MVIYGNMITVFWKKIWYMPTPVDYDIVMQRGDGENKQISNEIVMVLYSSIVYPIYTLYT